MRVILFSTKKKSFVSPPGGRRNKETGKGFVSYYLSVSAAAAAFAALIAFPGTAAEGVREGLRLCGEVIVPSLLPFFVLSGLIAALGLPQRLARLFERPMRRVFGVSGVFCSPFLLGLTGGYPVGAAAVAELVRQGTVSRREGERVLSFCNNTGPAFIIGAAGAGVFGSSKYGLLLYLSHIAAALAVGILFSPRQPEEASVTGSAPAPPKDVSLPAALTGAVKNAVGSVLGVGGFVLFFCVVKALLERAGLFSSAAGALAAATGGELRFYRALLTGLLELGGGIAAMSGLPASPANLALASFLLGFGSLSVHCQTLSVLEGTDMKCARHFAGRALHGVLSALFTFVAAGVLGV